MHSPCWNNRSNMEQIFRTYTDAFLEVKPQIPRPYWTKELYPFKSEFPGKFRCTDIHIKPVQDSIRHIQFLRSSSKDTLFRQLSFDSGCITAVFRHDVACISKKNKIQFKNTNWNIIHCTDDICWNMLYPASDLGKRWTFKSRNFNKVFRSFVCAHTSHWNI